MSKKPEQQKFIVDLRIFVFENLLPIDSMNDRFAASNLDYDFDSFAARTSLPIGPSLKIGITVYSLPCSQFVFVFAIHISKLVIT